MKDTAKASATVENQITESVGTDNIENNIAYAGLTSAEVSERVADGKINGEQTIKTKSVGRILASNIFTFFNGLFLVMAVILAFFSKFDKYGIGNFGFVILVVGNAVIGISQELRAKYTMDKLSLISAPKVTVIRDGSEREIAVKDIVLDDIMLLTSGCQICADAVIVGGSMEVNESLITGEPDAILKETDDEIMSGSFVVSGKAYAKVIHIGLENFAMKISAGAKYFKKPNSEILRSLNKVIKSMAVIIAPLGIALFLVKYLVQRGDLNETVITTIGSLVGMIPSGLVALSTAVFCLSIIRLAKHKTLAQDMYCVETLARVDVLCLDKTGTITEGTMEVNGVKPSDNGSEESFRIILKNLTTALADENATADAVRKYVADLEATADAETTVPFSSARKWSGAYFNGRSYVMGAPEFVFPGPSEAVTGITDEMAEQGLRVLAVASSPNPFEGSVLPEGLEAEGFLFISDKIRKEAPDTLKYFREQGVTVKIISGDNPVTVRAVAKRAGLENCDNIIDMSTLETEEEVYDAAEKYTIFGRVLPDQKLMLIKALKKNGHTVAMTGDGVNDVLALKESDCSIAMATGSDAAKNVSSLVLLDSNFASMPRVVAEGRRSINNLERSASLFLVKTAYNLLIALLFLIVPSVLPFAPKHLTLLGGVTIGIPSAVLAMEPNKERVSGRFLPKVMLATIPGVVAVMTGIICVVVATQAVLTDLNTEQIQSLFFLATVFAGFLYIIKVCWPFNLLRAALFVFVIGLLAACFTVNLKFMDLQAFFGLYRDLSLPMWKTVIVIWFIITPIFAATWLLDKKYNKRCLEKFTVYVEKRRIMHELKQASKA